MSNTSSNDNAKTLQAYNDHLQEYVDDQPKLPSPQHQMFMRQALTHIPKSGRILELGSGTGRDAEWIGHLGHQVDCTDAADPFVQYMRKRGLSSSLLDVLKDPFPGNYDLIYASAFLVHFDDNETRLIFQKAHDALNPRGIFALRTKEGSQDPEWSTAKLGEPRYMRYWTKSNLESTLEDSNFKVTSSYSSSGNVDYRGVPWLYVIAEKA